MLHKSSAIHNSSAAVLEPDLVTDVKKVEMKQAILERFCYRATAVTLAVPARQRSPYWQPVDEEC